MSAAQPLSILLIRDGAESLHPLHSHNHLPPARMDFFFLLLPLNNSFSSPVKDAAPLPQKSIVVRAPLCPASFRAHCLEEESFPWIHEPLEALILLPGLCAADIPVSSGNVISLARRLAGLQLLRRPGWEGNVEMFAIIGDNESPVLVAQWDLLGRAEKDSRF